MLKADWPVHLFFFPSYNFIGKDSLRAWKYSSNWLKRTAMFRCRVNSTNQRGEQFLKHQWQSSDKRESNTTKSIAYLWHSSSHQPKPTFLSFIHDWKAHGLNLILRDFQLCQTNHSLLGDSFLKNGESKKCEKRERLILIWQKNILNDNFSRLSLYHCVRMRFFFLKW